MCPADSLVPKQLPTVKAIAHRAVTFLPLFRIKLTRNNHFERRFRQCLSEDALKTVGPFQSSISGVYPRESKISHTGDKCVICRGINSSEINHSFVSPRMVSTVVWSISTQCNINNYYILFLQFCGNTGMQNVAPEARCLYGINRSGTTMITVVPQLFRH